MALYRLVLLLIMLGFAPSAGKAAELVMVEQAGCGWCEAWDREVGVVYPNTAEGRVAPLRRVNIHDPLPYDLRFIKGLVFTPTFVLVHEGREIGRITGYSGEDFFWGLLQELLRKLPAGKGPHDSIQTGPVQPTNRIDRTKMRG